VRRTGLSLSKTDGRQHFHLNYYYYLPVAVREKIESVDAVILSGDDDLQLVIVAIQWHGVRGDDQEHSGVQLLDLVVGRV
jgi:hypothetical protein